MQTSVIDDELVHVAKLPLPSRALPAETWQQPHGRLHGNIVLPECDGTYELESLVNAMTAELGSYAGNCTRLAIWRVSASVALVLVPTLRRLRISAVWFNDRWREKEARNALNASLASIVITEDGTLTHFVPSHITLLNVEPLPTIKVTCLQQSTDTNGSELSKHLCCDESIYFTSGSGGRPKGVRLSHESMDIQAVEKVMRIPFIRGDTYFHLAPHFHVGGASSTLAALHAGMNHVFITSGSLLERASQLLDTIQFNNVTVLVLVPGLLRSLVDTANSIALKLPHVRSVLVGAAPTDVKLAHSTQLVFPNAMLHSAYGLTECASSIAFSTLGDRAYKSPSHVELAVQVTFGNRGRILTRGPHVTRGYLGEEFRNSNTWFETGDIGEITNDRELIVVGRQRDIIRSGGETVDASEVERIIGEIDAVVLAVVVGVPHPVWGEAVAAAVKLQHSVPVQRIISHCRNSLAAFKVPRWIVQFDSIPTSPLGKVLKPAVRDMLLRELQNKLIRNAKL